MLEIMKICAESPVRIQPTHQLTGTWLFDCTRVFRISLDFRIIVKLFVPIKLTKILKQIPDDNGIQYKNFGLSLASAWDTSNAGKGLAKLGDMSRMTCPLDVSQSRFLRNFVARDEICSANASGEQQKHFCVCDSEDMLLARHSHV